MPKLRHADPVERLIFEQEYDIREALKRFYEGNTFSMCGTVQRQNSVRALLTMYGREEAAATLRQDWKTIDGIRSHAACAFEQRRGLIAALSLVFDEVRLLKGPAFHLTFADTTDRKAPGELILFQPASYRRRLAPTLSALRKAYPQSAIVGTIEVSYGLEYGVYEPHLHLLIFGVPKVEIEKYFRGVLKVRSRGHPLRVAAVKGPADRGVLLSYFFKFSPEVRTSLVGEDGRSRPGSRNLMEGEVLAEWTAFMAGYPIEELLIIRGLSASLMSCFRTCDLQVLIEKLTRSALCMPVRSVPRPD